jgi:t-SNARE complex subunit (syntaxin)
MLGKKKFEDTDTYKDIIKHQEEVERRIDSVRKENYRQLNDSINTEFRRELDSLKRSTDSLEKELEKSIQKLKNHK